MVSIIMPTFNGSVYIEKCIETVLAQTYKNFELIIIDDGSTDNTLSVCNSYAQKDNRITVIKTDNCGVSSARNAGISAAGGEYVTFVDDDDYLENALIEKYVEAFSEWKDKAAFVTVGIVMQNEFNRNVEDKNLILESGYGYLLGENYLLNRSVASTLAWLKLFNFVTNKCYRLSKIIDKNIKFDSNVNVGEDLKFNLDYLLIDNGNIGMINIPLYHYVKRKEDGLSLKYHEDNLKNTKEIYRYFIEWESKQKGTTEDNILVLKSMYIYDWTNRLTSEYTEHKGDRDLSLVRKKLNREIRSKEFRTMLKEVHKAKKISFVRYMCLRTGIYDIFYFARIIYMLPKG